MHLVDSVAVISLGKVATGYAEKVGGSVWGSSSLDTQPFRAGLTFRRRPTGPRRTRRSYMVFFRDKPPPHASSPFGAVKPQ
jgi:hypothetical protein